ncbi:hypothetical protein [Virgibacillus ndiopensis]|uniref:hypothetical protein n=1 Tax=Virgibacillus ndiopensis TaxID=2004408 RepID=UPI000C08BDD1|nr:hypothetical protein [Virgibacillus ndiopensis]
MSVKKISISILCACVLGLWTFVITLSIQQDKAVPFETHRYSIKDFVEKEIPSKQLVKVNKQRKVIDLTRFTENDNKVSIDAILASLNKE